MSEDMTHDRLEVLLRSLCTAVGLDEFISHDDLQASSESLRELIANKPAGALANFTQYSQGTRPLILLGRVCKEIRVSAPARNKDYPTRLANAITSKLYADAVHNRDRNAAIFNDSTTHHLCAAYSFASVAMRCCAEVSIEPGNALTFVLYQGAMRYARAAINLDEEVKNNTVGAAHPLHYIAGARAAHILSSYHALRHHRHSLLGQAYRWWLHAIKQDNGHLPNSYDFRVAAECANEYSCAVSRQPMAQQASSNFVLWLHRSGWQPESEPQIQKI